jgi:hypothetical protein
VAFLLTPVIAICFVLFGGCLVVILRPCCSKNVAYSPPRRGGRGVLVEG